MSEFTDFRTKMESAGVSEAAILAFKHCYTSLLDDTPTVIREDEITAIDKLVELESLTNVGSTFSEDILNQTVMIKLNGGLGTGMGLQKPKSLLNIGSGMTFLDVIVEQVEYLKSSVGSSVRFLLMNSFSTSESTLKHLEDFSDVEQVELLQNQIPKVNAETLKPVEYAKNPDLEWCPPGHGDLYAALTGKGKLDELLSEGVKYAFVSNADNLGAMLDPVILNYFVQSDKPFLMEVTRRTESDKKGGHLALRKEDSQMLLREVAQTDEEDIKEFQNIDKHQYFNTNNLWIRLDKLKELLDRFDGVVPLPMIKNKKTVDPRDSSSTPVFQLEIAMGAAISCFEGADAICVPRSRFAPVKATSDLMALRSDAYMKTDEGQIVLLPEREGIPPVIKLSKDYKLVDALEGLGSPSLKAVKSLTISGLVRFAENVVLKGEVTFTNHTEEVKWIASGMYENEAVEFN